MRVARLSSRAVAGPWRAIRSTISIVRAADLTDPGTTAEPASNCASDSARFGGGSARRKVVHPLRGLGQAAKRIEVQEHLAVLRRFDAACQLADERVGTRGRDQLRDGDSVF